MSRRKRVEERLFLEDTLLPTAYFSALVNFTSSGAPLAQMRSCSMVTNFLSSLCFVSTGLLAG